MRNGNAKGDWIDAFQKIKKLNHAKEFPEAKTSEELKVIFGFKRRDNFTRMIKESFPDGIISIKRDWREVVGRGGNKTYARLPVYLLNKKALSKYLAKKK